MQKPNSSRTDGPTHEIIIDPKTGAVRQAGTSEAGKWIADFRTAAEGSLYVFAKGILGLSRLTPSLHLPVANWLQETPPLRKLLMLPRDHLKTSIAMRAMTLHMMMQPAESNIYIPGKDGTSTRVLLACEKADHAENQLRWMKLQLESNALLRAFWPHRLWENAKRQSPKWSESAFTLPRVQSYPEACVETIGVGGAITGRHYDVLLKDDLVTFDAANSPVIMQEAIDWHKASRALLDSEDSLEFITGTKWANYDLYQEIIDNDPSVTVMVRMVVENGQPIFPEQFPQRRIDQLQTELAGRFFLLYMNTAVDPSLSEFDVEDLRYYTLQQATKDLHFEDDPRDVAIQAQDDPLPPPLPIGVPLNKDTYDLMASRAQFIRRARA